MTSKDREAGMSGGGRCMLRVATAVVACGLIGTLCGVQATTQAWAEGAPVLSASSATSQVSGSAAPALAVGATANVEGAVPALTASSYTSQVFGVQPPSSGAQATGSGDLSANGGGSDGTGASALGAQSASASSDSSAQGETFSMEADCASCHEEAAQRMADEGFTGALHVNLTCVTCHDDEEQLTEAHAEHYSAKQASRVVTLVSTTVDPDICFTCHGDQQALAQATADLTDLTDNNGTTVNPHDLPAIDSHAGITCGSCHKMHDDKTAVEASQNTCLNCHHDNVYECGTCHAV